MKTQTHTISVFAPNADTVHVRSTEELVAASRRSGGLFSATLNEATHGTRYTLHLNGCDTPALLDPFARCVDEQQRAVVVQSKQPSAASSRPKIPWEKTFIYEAHAKGLTQQHPNIDPKMRGTYRALAHPLVIQHLHAHRVTALQLLPIMHFVDAPRLLKLGLRNYWGYAPVNFFAPTARYRSCPAVEDTVDELKATIEALHQAGIEVILDVVFNHSGEDGHTDGSTVSLRGLAPDHYFAKQTDGTWLDVTGCGNTLSATNEAAQDLVMNSLEYWASEIGVDGFRFDLASTLGRNPVAFDPQAPLLQRIASHPVVGQLKLIAEPWDARGDGYQLGRFPRPYVEWNDRFRDGARRVVRGENAALREFADLWMGGERVFAGRAAQASLNFITSHDGMTLRDLVTYPHKLNERNGEQGRDGVSDDLANPISDPTLRPQHALNLAVLLLTAHGIPMWLAGDELWRTQLGNNNAYCHDDESVWVDWSAHNSPFSQAVQKLCSLRPSLAAFSTLTVPTIESAKWLGFDGQPRTNDAWHSNQPVPWILWERESHVVLCNFSSKAEEARIPPGHWRCAISTSTLEADESWCGEHIVLVPAHTVMVLTPTPEGKPTNK